MTFAYALFILAALLLGGALVFVWRGSSVDSFGRLLLLSRQDTRQATNKQHIKDIDWVTGEATLAVISDRLGKAGYFTKHARFQVQLALGILVLSCTILALGLGFSINSSAAPFIGAVVGFYVGASAALYFLSARASDFRREVLFQLPLTLETLILLVESGLGILPAIERLVAIRERGNEKNPVIRLLRLVYELSAHGMPFGQALELVADAADLKILRHVLLHLDISGSEGGELIPSLRSLSDHTHTEWKLSVETRVKRLENLVVFPVFISVLGLMLLTAAVPIVPVLNFRDTLNNGRSVLKSPVTTNSQSNVESVKPNLEVTS